MHVKSETILFIAYAIAAHAMLLCGTRRAATRRSRKLRFDVELRSIGRQPQLRGFRNAGDCGQGEGGG